MAMWTKEEIAAADRFAAEAVTLLEGAIVSRPVIVASLLCVVDAMVVRDLVEHPERDGVYRHCVRQLTDRLTLAGVPADARGN